MQTKCTKYYLPVISQPWSVVKGGGDDKTPRFKFKGLPTIFPAGGNRASKELIRNNQSFVVTAVAMPQWAHSSSKMLHRKHQVRSHLLLTDWWTGLQRKILLVALGSKFSLTTVESGSRQQVGSGSQLRLWFSSMAYVLLQAFRQQCLAQTSLVKATLGTIPSLSCCVFFELDFSSG